MFTVELEFESEDASWEVKLPFNTATKASNFITTLRDNPELCPEGLVGSEIWGENGFGVRSTSFRSHSGGVS